MPSTGSPTELNTIVSVIRPTPGIPAVPMDAKVAVPITVKKSIGVKVTPNACAVNTTATPCIIDVPSMLMVAPSGMVKEEIFLETPIFSAKVSIDNGHNREKVLNKDNRIESCKNLQKSQVYTKTLHR